MRFAYIDSNGNEVPIPSVDALALRIELGAITDETQLYDASADQWGPADTHEIYTTLQRSAGTDEGFVAPPPVASAPVTAEDAPAPEVEASAPEASDPGDGPDAGGVDAILDEDLPADDAGDISGLTLATAEPASEMGIEPASDMGIEFASDSGADLSEVASDAAAGDGLSLAEAFDAPVDELADVVEEGSDSGGLDLAPAMGDVPGEDDPASLELAEPEPLEEGEAPSFDFGGLEGGLEVDGPLSDDGDMLDFGPGTVDTGAPDIGPDGDFGVGTEPAPDFSGGMELESSMSFDPGGFDAEGGAGLDLEAPMSDFSPEAPPSWMDGGDAAGSDVMDFSSIASDAAEGDEAAAGIPERRTPRNRPSPPRHRKQRNLALPLFGIVTVLAIGVGGYAAWPIVSARLAERAEPDASGVALPELSAELMPVMQAASEAALGATFAAVVAEWNRPDRVDAPGTDWPGGEYMANASRYEVVEQFWSGLSDLLGAARGISLADFDGALRAELSSRGVSGADAEAIRERADSGFVAAASARQQTWNQFADVVDASLALHQFVIANEAGIEYVPASTATTNPVLEIDAATPEISAALDEMLGAVVDGLSGIGYRDVVSSGGLRAHVLSMLQATGVE